MGTKFKTHLQKKKLAHFCYKKGENIYGTDKTNRREKLHIFLLF